MPMSWGKRSAGQGVEDQSARWAGPGGGRSRSPSSCRRAGPMAFRTWRSTRQKISRARQITVINAVIRRLVVQEHRGHGQRPFERRRSGARRPPGPCSDAAPRPGRRWRAPGWSAGRTSRRWRPRRRSRPGRTSRPGSVSRWGPGSTSGAEVAPTRRSGDRRDPGGDRVAGRGGAGPRPARPAGPDRRRPGRASWPGPGRGGGARRGVHEHPPQHQHRVALAWPGQSIVVSSATHRPRAWGGLTCVAVGDVVHLGGRPGPARRSRPLAPARSASRRDELHPCLVHVAAGSRRRPASNPRPAGTGAGRPTAAARIAAITCPTSPAPPA